MKREHRIFWVAACGITLNILLLSLGGCVVTDTDGDATTTSSSNSSSNGGSCKGACNLFDTPYCCAFEGATSLFECKDGQFVHLDECDEPGSFCDANLGVCNCTPGSSPVCSSNSQESTQCVNNLGGANSIVSTGCNGGCDPATGLCVDCFDSCTMGDVICEPNLATVMTCQLGMGGCRQFLPEFSCKNLNMKCIEPSVAVSSLIEYCVNECNGRGIPLDGKMCQPDPVISCGTLVCDGFGKLITDKTGCLGGGQSCSSNQQCKSCVCSPETATCFTDVDAYCPSSSICGKKN